MRQEQLVLAVREESPFAARHARVDGWRVQHSVGLSLPGRDRSLGPSGRRVIVPDVIGFGLSEKPDGKAAVAIACRSRGLKRQSGAVHAVPQACRTRPVVEDLAEMAAAPPAMDLGAQHKEAVVSGRGDGVVGGVNGKRAPGAGIDTLPVLVVERAGEWRLGAAAAQDVSYCAGVRIRRHSSSVRMISNGAESAASPAPRRNAPT
jgi:hypothetical protein